MRSSWICVCFLTASVSAGLAEASGTRIITKPGGPTFADIQSAVNAAASGDVILVGSGTYSGFTIDGLGVWVVATPSSSVVVGGSVLVQNVPAGEDVLLSGLGSFNSRLTLSNCAGEVRLQSCQFQSAAGAPIVDFPCTETPPIEPPANLIQSCARVSLTMCDLRGTNGASCTTLICRGGEGQSALGISDSDVALYACNLTGGNGGNTINCAHVASGGQGCTVSGVLFASGSTFQGGVGGYGGNQATNAGPGGNGVVVAAGSTARLVECSAMGGAGGLNLCFPSTVCPGPPGVGISGRATSLPYARATFSGVSMFASGTSYSIALTGAPSADVWLAFAASPAHTYSPPAQSVRLLPAPLWMGSPAWTLPASGQTNIAFDLNYPQSGAAVQRVYAQCVFRDPSDATWRFGNPLDIVCIDRSAAPDCDADGVCDYAEIFLNPASDSNSNLVPDSCPGG
jgi:hypothetical protein